MWASAINVCSRCPRGAVATAEGTARDGLTEACPQCVVPQVQTTRRYQHLRIRKWIGRIERGGGEQVAIGLDQARAEEVVRLRTYG